MLIFDQEKIGANLLKARGKAQLTQEDVAEAAKITVKTFSDFELGKTNPRISTLLTVCDALHITPNDLLVEYDETEMNGKARTISVLENEERILKYIISICENTLDKLNDK